MTNRVVGKDITIKKLKKNGFKTLSATNYNKQYHFFRSQYGVKIITSRNKGRVKKIRRVKWYHINMHPPDSEFLSDPSHQVPASVRNKFFADINAAEV